MSTIAHTQGFSVISDYGQIISGFNSVVTSPRLYDRGLIIMLGNCIRHAIQDKSLLSRHRLRIENQSIYTTLKPSTETIMISIQTIIRGFAFR